MLSLKEQIFGNVGYSTDLKLSTKELKDFRQIIHAHWLSTIKNSHPDLFELANALGIDNYHQLTNKINHKSLWPKCSRILPQSSVNQIKTFPFFATLKKEFGEFTISDVYDTKQHYGQEEIYWRLVRPNMETDVGSLHKDSWFHGAANGGYGMFPDNVITVKVWIPLYCEKGKSGLSLLGGSHLKEWKYHIEVIDGMAYPKPDEDLSKVGATLMPTEPGSILLFNQDILHGGVLNRGEKTRVSAEITLVMKH